MNRFNMVILALKPPTPKQVLSARTKAGLTQTQAANIVCVRRGAWARWEVDLKSDLNRSMNPALFEYFLIMTGQIPFKPP